MLQEARHPLKETEVSIDEIELLCGNVHSQAFPPESFDLIFSIGVFGNGCEINRELLFKFHGWLTPDGCVLFDVFDSSELTPLFRIRERVRNYLQQHVGLNVWKILRRRAGESLPFYDYSSAEMVVLLQSCGFFPVAVSPQECQTPLGPGKKLECLGYKSSRTNPKPAFP
jgi:hypothetical protein